MLRALHFHLHRENLRSVIQDKSFKMWWLAEMTGVHKTTLRRWLSGRISTIQSSHLERLAAQLKVPVTKLVHHSPP